jgi:2-polyprenyl-3-methyl-5-hydroxy-6-metoxy-1,4-benzoquinol methylase
MSTSVEKHFDAIAKDYDYFKKKNWYYYKNLKSLYEQLIPKKKSVLEIGCGTGDLISGLDSSFAIGIDISPEMVKLAQEKHPAIKFEAVTIENFKTERPLDYIFLADVIEHIENIPSTIKALNTICDAKTKVIFSYANPLWEPILLLLEKLSLKMPEGPHYRIPYFKFKKILGKSGFATIERNWRLLIPASIPLLSGAINSFFYQIPLVKRLGMLEYIIIKKK